MNRRTSVLFLPLVLTAVSTPHVTADEVDDLVRSIMAEYDIPGVALAVVNGSDVVKLAGYGFASVELAVPVTPDTVFPMASTTKPFGGLAVMMLVEQGKLSLEDPITELLPDLPSQWSDITVRHILTHTSGLPDLIVETDVLVGDDVAESLAIVQTRPLEFPPGDQWSYNQTGYLLVGMLVEEYAGVSFGDFVLERIARPLGLTSASFGGATTLVPGRVPLYEGDDEGRLRPYLTWRYPVSGIGAAAGMNISARDFAAFSIAFHEGEFLNRRSREAMWTPVKLNDGRTRRFRMGTLGYGCGWGKFLYPGHIAYGHDGGGINVFHFFDDEKLAIIVLTNRLGSQRRRPPSYEILEGVARLYLPDFTTLRQALERFSALLTEDREEDAAYELARRLVDEFPENPTAMNWIAWLIASTEGLEHRDLALALEAATCANEATGHENTAVLDTLARVHYELGDLDAAVRLQQQAVNLAGEEDETADEIRARLQEYLTRKGAGTPPVAAPELVSFPTQDGGIIYADQYGQGDHSVVLAHGGQFNKESWQVQAQALAGAGLRVLAIDFRGYGKSRGGDRSADRYDGLHLDVLAAVRYLRRTGAKTVSVVGASIGGWAAAEASVEAAPGEINRLVLLAHSSIERPQKMKGRKLFITTREDPRADGSTRLPAIREQYNRAADPKELVILDGSAHAQHIFETDQGQRLLDQILRFLSEP